MDVNRDEDNASDYEMVPQSYGATPTVGTATTTSPLAAAVPSSSPTSNMLRLSKRGADVSALTASARAHSDTNATTTSVVLSIPLYISTKYKHFLKQLIKRFLGPEELERDFRCWIVLDSSVHYSTQSTGFQSELELSRLLATWLVIMFKMIGLRQWRSYSCKGSDGRGCP
ncbi:hypothetical protein CPB84DRAFT_1965897 [Gymnopilus junonius]|uniref:Uncharacterized protein n=1 Tax=Gymnopilus junonius TaxID=109634 RepID=A0A9P5NDX7_GYMJU|nr:hypothetical protein CPB84DRAFT_1965897 [Gymnopilus junonius]